MEKGHIGKGYIKTDQELDVRLDTEILKQQQNQEILFV